MRYLETYETNPHAYLWETPWRDALATANWQQATPYSVAAPKVWHSLPAVWQAAVQEWQP